MTKLSHPPGLYMSRQYCLLVFSTNLHNIVRPEICLYKTSVENPCLFIVAHKISVKGIRYALIVNSYVS